MNLTLKVWQQPNSETKGKIETYKIKDVSPDMSFLEMMDVLNEQLMSKKWIQLHLTMIVGRVFVECVLCL